MYQKQIQFFKNKKTGETGELIGKIISINKGKDFLNVDVLLMEDLCINIKFDFFFDPMPLNNKIYYFKIFYDSQENKKKIICKSFQAIEDFFNLESIYYFYSHFFKCSPISFNTIDQIITNYLAKIKNPILKKITTNLYFKNQRLFLIASAAFKMHHNYYGGLGYHTSTMLKLSDAFLNIYTYLDADLLYSGIILHDMAKISEFDFDSRSFTKEGILLGHLVLGVNNIHEEAVLLGFQKTEEVLLLKHLLISHHGLLEYGSPKKPQISEALLLSYLDNIDAKLNTLGEVLDTNCKGTFSEAIPVVEKRIFYKPDLNNIEKKNN